ncbi:MAG: HAD family hydrolase, partial [Vallitaleaceae bacterium]|nr:HAD family hydrolase [Vallitaleaceae bacterium]
NKGYILGVATSDQEESTRHGLKKVGIDSYFSYFGCDTIGKPGKPNPQMAYDFCELYHLRTEEILIVGDSLSDAEFAKNAEATFVGIQNEYGCFADVTDNNSVKLIHQMDELIKLFGL